MGDEPQPTSRRFRERQRRTRRHRRVNTLSTLVTLAVVVLVVLFATDTWRIGGRGPTLASGKTKLVPTTTPTASNAIDKLKRTNPPRPLSHAAPLRLWVGGDSLAGDLGYQLGPMLANTGIVSAHVDYKVSSGLASNAVRDWPAEVAQEIPQYQPESMVFMIGANDASIVSSAKDSTGAPAWEAKYRAKIDAMMNLLVGAQHRTVFWIGAPTLGTKYDDGARQIDFVMRQEAASRPTVVYVDAYSLFSANGGYSSYLDVDGQRTQVRTGDGVHFTVDGAKYLAQKVYALIDSRWNLTTQAATNEPISYTIEPASGTIGGVHLSNHGSPTTTAAPATTQAPTTTTKPTATTVAPTTTTKPTATTVAPTTTAKPPHT